MERIIAASVSITLMTRKKSAMCAITRRVKIMGSGQLMMIVVRSLKGSKGYAGRNGDNGR